MNKSVLIVDDDRPLAERVAEAFLTRSTRRQCPYSFETTIATSPAACVKEIRKMHAQGRHFDVVVLDIKTEEGTRSGIEAALALHVQGSAWRPVRIIFTGVPDQFHVDCVEAIRYDAWDYIVKRDHRDLPATEVVVNSAVTRLRQLDVQQEQEQCISNNWLPQNYQRLRKKYGKDGGSLVALWHKDNGKCRVHEIAHGRDAFELLKRLKVWQGHHKEWDLPYIIEIRPLQRAKREE